MKKIYNNHKEQNYEINNKFYNTLNFFSFRLLS